MKIEVGKRYIRRDGKVVGPIKLAFSFPYEYDYDDFGVRIDANGKHLSLGDSPSDLVAEYEPIKACVYLHEETNEIVISKYNMPDTFRLLKTVEIDL